jgi:hypothetical protein
MREFEIILLQTQRFIDKASIEAYITYNNNSGHFLRIRQWGEGGGGIYKKGPYYTERREMIDGFLVTKYLVWYRI